LATERGRVKEGLQEWNGVREVLPIALEVPLTALGSGIKKSYGESYYNQYKK
jgi:hypothetical protein